MNLVPHTDLMNPSPFRSAFTKLAAAAALLGCFAAPLHALPDPNITKGIWRLKHGVSAAQVVDNVWLAQDADGDGVTNGNELAAGTNPYSTTTTIRVKTVVLNGPNADLTFPSEIGKSYRAECALSLTPPATWNPVGSATPGTGGDLMISVTHTTDCFYRIRVSEVDTDNDGVSDWAENLTGLNPTLAQTTPGTNDGDYVNGELAKPNEVNIVAATQFASKDGPVSGKFMITRTQKLLPITVSLSRTGSAVQGTHYSNTLPGSVNFAIGEEMKELFVDPIPTVAPTGSKSVTEEVMPPAPGTAGFDLGASSTATVIINDSTVAVGSGLTARYYDTATSAYADALNFGQPSTGNFNYIRSGGSPYNGSTILVPTNYSGPPALAIGNQVKLSFNGGALNNSSFDDQVYTVTAVSAGVSFTVGISGAGLSTIAGYSASTCSFSIQSFPHPAVIDRIDPVVNNDWAYGTPNGVTITETGNVQTNRPDNYSDTFETYLHPTTAGNYQFQLDADDKARVLIDLDNNGTFELPGEQIVEHGWDSAATVGTFKVSAPIALVVPASAGQRYKMRVEHVETTGDARCRLQWRAGTAAFANIPQANQFTHTQAATYTFTQSSPTAGTAVITLTGHGFINTDPVTLAFSASNLFTPNASDPNGYSGAYTVANATANTFEVAITGTGLPATFTTAAACFIESRPASTTTGVFNKTYANTTFANTPGRIGVDAAVTTGNNGIWGSGTPDVALMNPDTYSIRWTGQVQPQFSEDYTFVVHADDGCALYLNGQLQTMKMSPSANTGGSNYIYDATTGELIIAYAGLATIPGSFIVGENTRIDPSSSALNHAPTNTLTYTYDGGTGDAVIDYTNLTVGQPGGTRVPGSYTIGEIVEVDPTSGSATALATLPYVITAVSGNTFTVNFGTGIYATGAGNINVNDPRNTVITKLHATGTGTYTYTSTTGDTVVTYTSLAGVPASSFTVGGKVHLDPTSGNISALAFLPYTITAATATNFTVNVGTGFTTGTGNITIVDPRTGIIPDDLTTGFTVNIGPGKYADLSTGTVNVDIVNKSLKTFSSNGNERYVRIPMVGGVRYDIQLDYYESTSYARCALSWYSPSQPKQFIPTERLYPSTGPLAPTAYVAPTDATALVGGAFSHAVAGSNGGNVTISGNPAWLTYSGGVISGTPPGGTAGDYQIIITVTNAAGSSTSVLNLHVEDTGGSIVREYWNGVYASLAAIPTSTAPTGTGNLTSLEAVDAGDDFGVRIRGYITAPTTGNYYFWIAASSSAELWISNDDDPINALKRAWVTTGNATPQTWAGEATQISPWLALEQGKKYYIEILQRAAAGADNLAIGWAKPGEATTAPSQVVPGFVLSPYVAPAPGSTPGTLYVATMLAQAGATTNGVGTATVRVNEDETVAYIRFSHSGLTGALGDWHVHPDPYLGKQGGNDVVLYDGAEPLPGDGPQPDGSHKWNIIASGPYTLQEVRDLLKQGKAYLNLHTVEYPNGEIRGNFTLANGSRTFTPPPAPPAWSDDHATDAGAARFLTQATFGANIADIQALKAMASYEAWIDDQFTKPPTSHLTEVLAREIADVFGPFDVRVAFNSWWKTSMSGQDQLRQRVAFALSEIHVVSGEGPLEDNSRAMSHFYDRLAANAFGNFRDVLIETTLTPGMGRYLDMLRNDKPDLSAGRIPNENYAREIKQLFSIGLYRMWPDGTLMLNATDSLIDTYTQREIVGLAHVLTGWDYGYDGPYRTSFSAPTSWTRLMREVPARHFTGPKRVLNNEVMPGLSSIAGQPLDPYATHVSAYFNDPAFQTLPGQELNFVHDQLFNHPNTGPFICRQLIQRLVTSNPSRDYLYRVVQKFNDNGSGVRGDMKAVIKAILLDYESRHPDPMVASTFGKQREPIMRVANAARAFRPASVSGTYAQAGGQTVLITTSTPHLLSAGNSVFLEFEDATTPSAQPALTTGTYTVLSTTSNPPAPTNPTTTTYYIAAPGWMSSSGNNYTQTGGTSTITVTMSGHWLPAGGQAYFKFVTAATGTLPPDGIYTAITSTAVDTPSGVGNVSGTTFTITAPDTTARTGRLMISRFPGSYSCTGAGGVITIDTAYGGAGTFGVMADHHLAISDNVFLNFTNSRDTTSFNETSTENDIVYPIVTLPDLNTFTVTARSAANAAMNSDNQVVIFPLLPQPLVRNGTFAARQSTYTMDNTDADLEQTPLNSPTVFNYFLPDYKFAGALASQGLTTPEFQITAETTTVRQANFMFNGIFNPTNTEGVLSSFKTGTNALVLDLNPWMGNATDLGLGAGLQAGQPWTSNANLSTLIDRLNTLLLAGQLPASAKTTIETFINYERTISAIAAHPTNPCSITTSAAHGLLTGDGVTISGVTGGTFTNGSINATHTVVVTGATTFTIGPVVCTSTAGLGLTNARASYVPYNNVSPSTTNKRDRLRAVLHFILTSPDYTIQR